MLAKKIPVSDCESVRCITSRGARKPVLLRPATALGRGSIIFAVAISCIFLAGCTPPGPRALLEGKRLLERGKYPQAVEQFKLATSILSTNAQAWNYYGVALQSVGKNVDAERAYARAISLDRDLTEAHYNLGSLRLAQNNLEGARAEFTTYTLRRPNSVEGLLKLGTVQLRVREYAAADQTLNQVLQLDKQSVEAMNLLGLVRLQRGRPDEAVQWFTRALREQSDYPPALLNLAVVSQQSYRNRGEAIQRYQAYLALKPTPADAEAVRAVVNQLQAEQTAATRPPAPTPTPPPSRPQTTTPTNTVKSPVAPTTPTQSVARVTPAPSGNPTAAPSNVPRQTPIPPPTPPAKPDAVRLPPETVFRPPSDNPTVDPKPQPPRADAGSATAASGPRYTYLSPARPAAGDRRAAEPFFNQGMQLNQAKQYSEAAAAYKQSVKQDPAFFEASYNLGLAAMDSGDLPTALSACETALALRPDSVDTRYNFALALRKAGYAGDAAAQLDLALKQAPNDNRCRLTLANLYAQQLRQTSLARREYLRLLESDPHNSQASAIRAWLANHPQ